MFVCLNERPEGGQPSCGRRGGRELLSALQREILAQGLAVEACAVGCQCLGPCFDGPSLVVYPDGTWYAGAQAEDAKEIVREHLAGGRPVERLRYEWE